MSTALLHVCLQLLQSAVGNGACRYTSAGRRREDPARHRNRLDCPAYCCAYGRGGYAPSTAHRVPRGLWNSRCASTLGAASRPGSAPHCCGVRTLQTMRVMVQIRRCLQVEASAHVEAHGNNIWGCVDPRAGSGVDPQTSRYALGTYPRLDAGAEAV